MRRIACTIGTVLVLVALQAPAPARTARAAGAWDFDGDGRRDLAIGISGENDDTGSVVVIRATASGLSRSGVKRFSQDTPQVPDAAEPDDFFGSELASGDFDADGYADLAVAAHREDTGAAIDAGTVTVFYGSTNGLRAAGSHRLRRPETVFGDSDPTEDFLGFVMAAADFDGDGDHDLAVTTSAGNGGVLVHRGRASGLEKMPSLLIQDSVELQPSLGPVNALETGDLDGNGVADLAIGFQEYDQARGAVAVVYGARTIGLDVDGERVTGPQVWTQDSTGVRGTGAALDAFGSALGIGDVTGDGRKDLVVAALQQPTGTAGVQGALHVLRGTRNGVTAARDQYLRYDDLVGAPLGRLGSSLAVGDLNGNGIADVAVTHGTRADHNWGAVLVLYGHRDGLGSHRKRSFTQATEGIGGSLEPVDYWGEELRIRDAGGTRHADLIVGDMFEDVAGVETGMVNVLWGSASGVRGADSRKLTQDSRGVPGTNEADDHFGSAL